MIFHVFPALIQGYDTEGLKMQTSDPRGLESNLARPSTAVSLRYLTSSP